MAIFDDITKGPVPILLGLGVAMAAPNVIPALAAGLRPLAKALVKGGLTLYDAAKEGVAEAGEQLNDLVAETRAEMAQNTSHADNGAEAEAEYVGTPNRSRRRRSRP
jgi:hypothetical protein